MIYICRVNGRRTCGIVEPMEKPIFLSGIKPTGDIHIGNYFGAIKQLVDIARAGKHTGFIMIADYHALNFIQNAAEMSRLTRELAMTYIACGLDPKQVTIFKQSDVPAHTELAWIFDTITPVPYLMLAHAFKSSVDKAFMQNHPDYLKELDLIPDNTPDTFRSMVNRVFTGVNVGTFNYPMLMAADILLYDAAVVPVGQDQKQHIEYARDTAQKFNHTFGQSVLALPEPLIVPDVATVPGIDGQKMSKSYGNTIPLFASREQIEKLVAGIVTDSGADVPANVYAIHRLLKTEAELAPLYEANKGKYKALKDALAADLEAFIAPLRQKYEALAKNPKQVDKILAQGGAKARKVAEKKMATVRQAIGVA